MTDQNKCLFYLIAGNIGHKAAQLIANNQNGSPPKIYMHINTFNIQAISRTSHSETNTLSHSQQLFVSLYDIMAILAY